MANILVVDDDKDLARVIQMMLERAGHNIVTANNGEQGIAVATQHPIDMLVLDVMMPDMDGYEVTRRLRSMERTKRLPILILSARAQPIDQQMALDAGANAFLAKPVTPQSLTEKVSEVLSPTNTRSAAAPAPQKRIIHVMGLREGVGKTTFAVNLALALIRTNHRACLVELTPNGGQVALHLGLRPGPGWGALLRGVNPETMGQAVIKHPSGLFVLMSPPQPQTAPLPGEALNEAVKVLHKSFNDVVIDSSSWSEPATRMATSAAAVTFLLIAPEVAAVQSAVNTLGLLKAARVNLDKVHVVLNHINNHPELSRAAVEKALGRPVKAILPYDPAQAQALMKGAPLILSNPNQPYVSDLGKAFGVL